MSASPIDCRRLPHRLVAMLALCLLAGCGALGVRQTQAIDAIVARARPVATSCDRPDACARPSALHALAGRAFAESTPDAPRHYTLLLDRGSDALLARIDLIRSATTSIDLQTYIFDEDDAGRFVLDELIAAAKRGVRVRLIMDQLAALKRVDTLAALAGQHRNLQVRIYNPVLGRARITYPGYVLAGACCWRTLNQRMHTKLLLIDGALGITGGRNYQDDYYDWDAQYNFRDRDLLIAGPAARDMSASFQRYWTDARSVPVEHLRDVGHRLLDGGMPALTAATPDQPARLAAAKSAADDATIVRDRLVAQAMPVGGVQYVADPPGKGGSRVPSPASSALRQLIANARERVMLQTPYLVLSKPARSLFRELHRRPDAPRVIVSTNSLASTDAFIAYALSYKYKRRYLREYGFEIYEMKPFPADAPIDVATTGAVPVAVVAPAAASDGSVGAGDATRTAGTSVATTPTSTSTSTSSTAPSSNHVATATNATASSSTNTASPDAASSPRASRIRCDRSSVVDCAQARQAARIRAPRPLAREFAAIAFGSRRSNAPVPLQRAGVRMGLHAKSLVVDDEVGVVGTHNFDPRGDRYNTEAMVVVRDPAFARALAASIQRDIAPANSWVIAPRDKPLVLSGIDYSAGKLSERLPLFDLWPRRYATSYAYAPSPTCPQPLPPTDARFRDCYQPVGDFPEVDLGFKSVLTRIFTAFGAGLAPIL